MFHGVLYTDVLVGEVPIVIMDLIPVRNKTKFRESFRLLPPSYLYGKNCAKERLNDSETIPRGIRAVQLHYVNIVTI